MTVRTSLRNDIPKTKLLVTNDSQNLVWKVRREEKFRTRCWTFRRNLQGSAKRKKRKSRHERARTKVNRFAARISRVQVHARRPTPTPMDLQTYFRPFKDGRSCVHHPTRVRNRPSLSREPALVFPFAMLSLPPRMSFASEDSPSWQTNESDEQTEFTHDREITQRRNETRDGRLLSTTRGSLKFDTTAHLHERPSGYRSVH